MPALPPGNLWCLNKTGKLHKPEALDLWSFTELASKVKSGRKYTKAQLRKVLMARPPLLKSRTREIKALKSELATVKKALETAKKKKKPKKRKPRMSAMEELETSQELVPFSQELAQIPQELGPLPWTGPLAIEQAQRDEVPRVMASRLRGRADNIGDFQELVQIPGLRPEQTLALRLTEGPKEKVPVFEPEITHEGATLFEDIMPEILPGPEPKSEPPVSSVDYRFEIEHVRGMLGSVLDFTERWDKMDLPPAMRSELKKHSTCVEDFHQYLSDL